MSSSLTSEQTSNNGLLSTPFKRIGRLLSWMPPRCRYNESSTRHLSLPMNLLFALASTISIANMYYSYPILNKIALDFNVSYERSSLIATLMQAGYGTGILFICPLADHYRIRPFVLGLVFFTATIWICLCLTTNFTLFLAVSFITGFTTVIPPLMIPLTSALAHPARKATAISITFSGLMLGMLLPRVLAGVVTEYTNWRNIYWAALGIQYALLGILWYYLPDYPPINLGQNYARILWSIVSVTAKHPIVANGCAVVLFSNAVFASYWTTLTALLSSEPYFWSPLQIGLFALVGIAPLLFVPPYSRVVIDRLVPNISVLAGLFYAIIGVVIGTFIGTFTIARPIIEAIAVDFGIHTASIAYRAAIYSSVPKARNRTNVAYTVAAFVGQLIGTSVGNRLYALGGWVSSGYFNIGFLCAAVLVTLMRGPSETKWIGWHGGWHLRRKDEETINSNGDGGELDDLSSQPRNGQR